MKRVPVVVPEELKAYRAPRTGAPFATELLCGLALVAVVLTAPARDQWVEELTLDDSAVPATLDECQRARPQLPRPDYSISHQDRTGQPWRGRSCFYEKDKR